MAESIVIRTSDRGTFRKCRQLWDFTSAMRQNWAPIREHEPLEFGTAFHAALEAYYDPFSWDWPYENRKKLAIAQFTTTTDEQYNALPSMFKNETEVQEEYAARIELGKGMLNYYLEWSKKYDTITPVAVELKFEVPVIVPDNATDWFQTDEPYLRGFDVNDSSGKRCLMHKGSHVVYQGKIDMICQDEDGDLWLWDHKTAARFGELDWLSLDTQINSYCWAARELGYDIQGFVYSQIRKAYPEYPKVLKSGKLSRDKSQNTTYELYLEFIEHNGYVRSDYEDFLQYLREEPKQYVRRRAERRSKQELDNHAELIYNEALDMVAPNSIYPNPSEFNCNKCKFYDPCLALREGGDVDYFFSDSGLYVQRET